MTKIKICGITNREDALQAARLGADMLGFIFARESPRYVNPRDARGIVEELPERVARVGVFVNEDPRLIAQIVAMCGLDMVQLHGEETVADCERLKPLAVIKAFKVKTIAGLSRAADYPVDYFLLDTYIKGKRGGTGIVFDWGILAGFSSAKPIILSGGLTPVNVARAVREVAPYGVDVSSGVEALIGKKDEVLVRDFILSVRKADGYDAS